MLIYDKYDPDYGVRTRHHIEDGKIIDEAIFDAEAIIDSATEIRNSRANPTNIPELRPVLRIPIAMFYQMLRNGELGELAMETGSPVITNKTAAALRRKYPRLCLSDKF
jgi:hypothetical protein